MLVTILTQRWFVRAKVVGLRSPTGNKITAKWTLIVDPDAQPEGRGDFSWAFGGVI